VQLFTVRNDIADLGKTLRLIHDIGYASVETFPPIYNRPAKELNSPWCKQLNSRRSGIWV
jgi:hypothetical protein